MAQLKKISSTLSIAATVLLGACSTDGGSSAPAAEANTSAPLLIGNWQTTCTKTAQGTSSTTTGSSGGGGSVTGGKSFIAGASFTQDGHVVLNAEFFSSTDCNANTSNSTSNFAGVYFIGDASFANDGSNVTGIDISDSNSTTFSIFQIVNSTRLFLGIKSKSSTGNDGSKQSTRYDGLGERYTKK